MIFVDKRFNKVRDDIICIVEKLSNLNEDNKEAEALKFSYYSMEIGKKGQHAFELLSEIKAHKTFVKPFENGNNTGIPVVKADVNCPYCGLTPLTNSPEGMNKLSDYFCNTCDRFVIFTKTKNNIICKLDVTDNYILVL